VVVYSVLLLCYNVLENARYHFIDFVEVKFVIYNLYTSV